MPFVIRLTALNESYYWNDKANAFGPLKNASIYPGTQAAPQELVVNNLRGGFTVLDRTIKDGSTLYEDGEGGKLIELVPTGGDLDRRRQTEPDAAQRYGYRVAAGAVGAISEIQVRTKPPGHEDAGEA